MAHRYPRGMSRVYIHEVVTVEGTERARYQHHMTANWVPEATALRRQRCFGVFTLVGSTGEWPRVVNIWEYDRWDDLAHNFSVELATPTHRDPMLAEWWEAAAAYRSGGSDRILVEHGSNPGVGYWESRGGTGAVAYMQEVFLTAPGRAAELAASCAQEGVAAMGDRGIQLAGLWLTAMRADDEVVVLWTVPDWLTWAAFEHDQAAKGVFAPEHLRARERTLLVDAELSPLRTGRQPVAADRRPIEEL